MSASIDTTKTRRPRTKQPLEALELPDALLTITTVSAVIARSVSTIYRMVAAGDFIAPVKFGTRCTRWRAGEVTAWLRAQGATK